MFIKRIGRRGKAARSVSLIGMESIYYETFEGAFRWNFKSGARTLILKFQDAGVANKYDKTVFLTKDGRLFYHFYDGAGSQGKQGKEWIVSLSEEEPAGNCHVKGGRSESSICL